MGGEHNHADGMSHLVVSDSAGKEVIENTINCKPCSHVSVSENSDSEVVSKSAKVETNLHKEIYVYRQDVVRCIRREDMLGVVLEIPGGDSDSEGSVTDDSDAEDGENENAVDSDHDNEVKDAGDFDIDTKDSGDSSDKKDPLSDNEVRVMWLDGTETTNNLSDVVVIDRSFLPGDFVSSMENPTGQLGVVVDAHITVDLLSPAGKLVRNVSSLELTRMRKFNIGDYVVQGPWLGRVEDVLDNITVLFDDGAECKVLEADPSRLKPVSRSMVDDTGFPYHPGRRVRAASSSVFKKSRFLSGSWKPNRCEGTVTNVEVGSVFVYWTSSSSLGTGANPATAPPERQKPKNLTLVSCMAHANWQLGEWCLFSACTVTSDDTSRDKCKVKYNILENDVVGQSEDVTDSSIVKTGDGLDILDQVVDANVQQELDQGEEEEADILEDMDTDSLDSHLMVDSHRDSFPVVSLVDNYQSEVYDETNTPPEIGNASSYSRKDSIRENHPVHRKNLRKVTVKRENKGHRKAESSGKAFQIVNITTKVDVAWQDGTREDSQNSTSLIPVNSPGEQDFCPEEYVVEKASNESEDSETKRVGVIKSVNAKERTACVRWLKPVSRPEDPRMFDEEEVVSVYELDQHPDYDYCYGDVVIRLAPMVASAENAPCENSVEEGNDHVFSNQEDEDNRNSLCTTEQPSNDMAESIMDLSWVGHVTGLQDGDIEVTWADGMISKVGPQAIFVVGRDDDETFDGGSETSWETVEENDMNGLDLAEESVPAIDDSIKEGEESYDEDDVDNTVASGGPLSSAFSFVTKLATGIFSRVQNQAGHLESEKKENTSDSYEQKTYEDATELGDSKCEKSGPTMDDHGSQACVASVVSDCSLVHKSNNATVAMDFTEHTSVDTGMKSSGANEGDFDYKHFDITKDPLDHYFFGETGQVTGERKWAKKIQQEWNILEKNLPDAIFVRVFEDRIDLLRAAIIGASGTPYQDGIFFFDFQLPPEYPQGPPKAHYNSGGLRINPNLYEDGKVCLSLLNTWTGKGNEVWDPSSSSILQVLVSIQGLVLNSKPYFNEAGYEKQIGTVEGEKNCLPYNENTYLLNLKSMMYLLRRPPMHFEDFTKDHFRRRGSYILKACDSYMKGAVVGSLTKDADATEESNTHSCSVGFRLMLTKIIPRLFTALREIGAECDQYQHLLGS